MGKVTVCSLDCPDACSLIVDRSEEGAIRVRGNPDNPMTRGFTCAKILNYVERMRSSDRIITPLRKTGTTWNTIGWDEALMLCAEKIQECRGQPASILHLHGDGAKGVLKFADKLFFGRIGASHTKGSLCDTAGITACIADFGSLEHNDIRDVVNAETIVNWGRDLSRSSIHVAALVRDARKRGAKVITISPGGDGNGPFSDFFVRVRPGTDRFLAAALIRLLIDRHTLSDDILHHAGNWKVFEDMIRRRSVAELLSVCEVALEDCERLCDCYCRRKPVATLVGWGLQRYRFGGENVRFINALSFLSGNVGISSAGVYYGVSSLRNFNLDWAYESVEKGRRTFPLPLIGRSIMEARDPAVKMIWVNGFNVVNQAPDSLSVKEAFRRVEFRVVVDAFMTDTAEMADLILPCAFLLEQEDIVGSFLHDYIHYAEPVVRPPGEAWDDFRIFTELGKRLSPPVIMPPRDEILRKALNSPYVDISLEELKTQKYTKAAWPAVAYEGMKFKHPDGLYHLPDVMHDEAAASSDFPLQLLSLIRREAIHSQIPPEEGGQVPTVWIAPDSVAWNDIDTKQEVYLVSPRGRLRVAVATFSGLHPKAVIYRRGDWIKTGGGVNQLIDAALTDMGDGASYYSQSVRLEN